MTAEDILAAVHLLNARTARRARALACAVDLLRDGRTRREAIVVIRSRFLFSQPSAWRVVDMAADMAGKAKP
jgi:hypothetical protein